MRRAVTRHYVVRDDRLPAQPDWRRSLPKRTGGRDLSRHAECAIETDPNRPKRCPEFAKSQNLIPARCEALDHRLALFR